MDQRSLNSHKNKGHSPFFLPPIMRSSVGQCRNIRFRQLYASHVIITIELGLLVLLLCMLTSVINCEFSYKAKYNLFIGKV